MLQRLADRWCTTSAWNYFTGAVAAWGETRAIKYRKGTWQALGETTNLMAKCIFSQNVNVKDLYFVEIQKLKHMGHIYEEKTTWVIAQTKQDFVRGLAPQLGQLVGICSANDETYVSITYFPDFVVDDNWNDEGLLAIIERRLNNQCRDGRSHTVTQALGTLAVTPLRRINYYFSNTGEGRAMSMHVLR